MPRRQLIIVDYQNDFARPDGALVGARRRGVAGAINAHAASGDYDLVLATRDWHPPDHGSFAAQGGPWPDTASQGTEGAELHPDARHRPVDAIVDKGQDPGTDGYSGFDGDRRSRSGCAERGVDDAHDRRARHGLLRPEHRARRAARGLRRARRPGGRARRGGRAGRLRAGPRGAAGRGAIVA